MLKFYVGGKERTEYISHVWDKTNDELINAYSDCALELFKVIFDEIREWNLKLPPIVIFF